MVDYVTSVTKHRVICRFRISAWQKLNSLLLRIRMQWPVVISFSQILIGICIYFTAPEALFQRSVEFKYFNVEC